MSNGERLISRIGRFSLILFFTATIPVYAQYGVSLEGGGGLLNMNSAKTIGNAHYAISLQYLGMQRDHPRLWNNTTYFEPTDYPTIFFLPVVVGITDYLDLTGSINYYHDVRALNQQSNVFKYLGDPESGFGSARAAAKVRFPRIFSDDVHLALKAGATFDTSDINLTGMNYRWVRNATDVDISFLQTFDINPKLSLHFEEGYVISGDVWFDNQALFSAGIEYIPTDKWAFGLELNDRTFLYNSPMDAWREGPYTWYYPSASVIGDPRELNDEEIDFGDDYIVITPSVRYRISNTVTLNAGLLINVADEQIDPKETMQFNAGITFAGAFSFLMDTDKDGVKDNRDREMHTPLGFPVDSYGVSLDSDGDGVPDGRDLEINTPQGATVDQNGVGIDSDGDGVYDGLDREPNTPRGATVDQQGRGIDSDGDGVYNGIDLEPATPLNYPVDQWGVSLDSDGDGVPDGRDLEPNTPRGLEVDEYGRAIRQEERTFLDEGVITVYKVNFATGSSQIQPDSYDTLNTLADILVKYPTLNIQIEGHTDNTGSRTLNMRLSQSRAQAVLDYLLSVRPDLNRARFTVVGYGPDRPVSTNGTQIGRQQNRRVEFVVTNKEELEQYTQ